MSEIYHLVDLSGPHCARVERARVSWGSIYANEGIRPIHATSFHRTAASTLSDPRPLPYLKDLLAVALEATTEDDIIVWANSDIALKSGISDFIRAHLGQVGAASMRRTESNGHGHPGRDLFAFTHLWLRAYLPSIPDYILGAPVFDLGLVALIRKQHGLACELRTMGRDMPPAEMKPGYALHESHSPAWEVHNKDVPSTTHNRLLFKSWASEHAPELRFNRDNNLR